jgi:Ca-activated chloride channel family protein
MRYANSLIPAAVIAALLCSVPLSAQQGPVKETGDTVSRPKKKDTTAPEEKPPADAEKIPSKINKSKETTAPVAGPTFRSDATTVTVDVAVLDNKGRFIPGIPSGNFRVLEDGVPQKLANISTGEAPMTVCMVIEFSNLFQQYWTSSWMETLQASYGFLETLKPEDYVAVVAYDMRPEILSDFSEDKRTAYDAMARLRIAAFSESNLFDALVFTAERMETIEGRKAIVLIASGIDTFSKLTYDKTRRILQDKGVPIYAIGIMQALRMYYDSRGAMSPIARLDFLQADNEMTTFAKETGGQAFFPRFIGEFPNIYRSIQESLRSQYTISYTPSNLTRDGKFRKIRVDLVNPATNEPLKITDEKGKPLKYTVIAKAGYTAPREVE